MKIKENISDLIGDWDLMNIEHEEAVDILVKYFSDEINKYKELIKAQDELIHAMGDVMKEGAKLIDIMDRYVFFVNADVRDKRLRDEISKLKDGLGL